MTDEEKEQIFEQAFRNISSVERAEPSLTNVIAEDPLEAWAAGMPKPEPEPRKRKLDTRPRQQGPNIFEWVEQRLEAERQFVLEVVGESLGEMLEQMHQKAKTALQDEVRELKIEICQLETTLCELRQVIAKERGLTASPQSLRLVN